MSRTLNLVNRLLAMGRKYQELGRDYDARHILGRLAGFRELPAPVAEETQMRLAELHLKRRRFRRARRCLTAALAHLPDHAHYHYLLAHALDNDPKGNPRLAAVHYRRSLELDPNQPLCLGEFGLLVLRLGQSDEGLEALRRAAALAPDNSEVIGNLVEGLRQEGLLDEARRALRAALFRNPRDPRFRRLRSDFEYHQLHLLQEARRCGRLAEHDGDRPVLLPFIRPPTTDKPAGQGRRSVRSDGAARPGAPHLARHGRHPGHKRAQ
jgi:tetratricopeptide (TPR) repeat protein